MEKLFSLKVADKTIFTGTEKDVIRFYDQYIQSENCLDSAQYIGLDDGKEYCMDQTEHLVLA